VARADDAAFMGTVQVFFAPRQAPLQERSFHPFAGVAVRRTGVNEGNAAEHRGRHVIPARELRTAPRPATLTLSGKVVGPKTAATLVPAPTAKVHPALPVQAPSHRTSFAPAAGVAVSAILWPAFQVVVQLAVHVSPGTLADTEPRPEIVSPSGT
jgi:hypothetical protein